MSDDPRLKKLKLNTNPQGGRPTQYRDDLPDLYYVLRSDGISHEDILSGWGVHESIFRAWRERKPKLNDALLKAESEFPDPSKKQKIELPDNFTKDSLRKLASETLFELLKKMNVAPGAYKAGEIISACREALDRTDGKPAQTMAVEQKQTITHNHLVSLSPADAYKRLIEMPADMVIEHDPD